MRAILTEDELYDECANRKESCLDELAWLQESAERLQEDFDDPALVDTMMEQAASLGDELIRLAEALAELRELREAKEFRKLKAILG